MKVFFLTFILTFVAIFSFANPQRRMRVKLSAEGLARVQSQKELSDVAWRKLFPCTPDREAEHRRFGLDRWYELSFDETRTTEVRRIIEKEESVEALSERKAIKLLEDGEYDIVEDPLLERQWNYAAINLFEAWEVTTGSAEVIVAIIDGGIDTEHEDLAANMWVNVVERDGEPGVDDDGNGYIDDVWGYNFCARNAEIHSHSHGTHVAGIVAATNNNGLGVGGIAGGDGTEGSGVRMMTCQVFDTKTDAEGDFAAALVYAADMGASIAQCSWAWEDPDDYEEDVLDAVHYFTESARSNCMSGGLCVFGAGNNGMNGRFYPACLDEVVAVAAMDAEMHPAYYSNYGDWIDVVAPGGTRSQAVLSTLPGSIYGYNAGTSMATPHVSGVAALVLSRFGSQAITPASLKAHLKASVGDFYALNPDVEGLFGSGNIDAAKAMVWEGIEDIGQIINEQTEEGADELCTLPGLPQGFYVKKTNGKNRLVFISRNSF